MCFNSLLIGRIKPKYNLNMFLFPLQTLRRPKCRSVRTEAIARVLQDRSLGMLSEVLGGRPFSSSQAAAGRSFDLIVFEVGEEL